MGVFYFAISEIQSHMTLTLSITKVISPRHQTIVEEEERFVPDNNHLQRLQHCS